MKNREAEDAWLRFFLRRLRLGLRKAKSPDNSSGTEGACCRRRATAGAANIVATQLSKNALLVSPNTE